MTKFPWSFRIGRLTVSGHAMMLGWFCLATWRVSIED